MSSFIHTPRHFNSVERAIKFGVVGSNNFWTYGIKRKFRELDSGCDIAYSKVEELIDELRKLNVLCVSLQYKHHYEGVLDREIEEQTEILMSNKSESEILDKFGLYKALQSINYQIETYHLKDLRELTQGEKDALWLVEELVNDLAHDIVNGLQGYNDAKWSI